MLDFFGQLAEWQASLFAGLLRVSWMALLLAGGLAAWCALLFALWLNLSHGLRRQERARCFLALIDLGLAQGRTVEHTVVSLAQGRVRELGVWFHLVAAWMQRGLKFDDALKQVPQFVPAQVRALLRAGSEVGDLRRVLSACRALFDEGPSRSQRSLNNLIVLLFVSPLGPALVWFISVWIVPKFHLLLADMAGNAAPLTSLSALFDVSLWLANGTAIAWLLFCLAVILQDAAHWLPRPLASLAGRAGDWSSYVLPWRRRRLQRQFSVMLALSLDAGLPEAKALELAAESTANRVLIARARRMIRDLAQGLRLTEVLDRLDRSGEFRWRLQNAVAGQPFSAALAGWHDALAAKAFQQEQIVSQAVTTGFVLLNGAMVACLTLAVFQVFVVITEAFL